SPSATRALLSEDWPNGIVVATDGRAPSEAAVLAAHHLARPSTFGVISVTSANNSTERASRRSEVTPTIESPRDVVAAQLQRLLGESPDAWIELRSGYPPAV